MLTALVLILVIAGIVVLSRRWPDVEHRLWPDRQNLPKAATAEPPGPVHHRVPHAPANAEPAVEEVVVEPSPSSTPATPPATRQTAGGIMTAREIAAEPEVNNQPAPASEPEQPAEPSFLDAVEEVAEPEPEVPVVSSPATPTPPVAGQDDSTKPATDSPGERVTGSPAIPSEPAYFDATSNVSESVDELARQADQAFRDREYERAEQACLKILVQQPKNHKYMTRIGQIYQEMGSLEDAKEAYEAAKNLDPKNFFVLNRLAEVERQLSDKGGRSKSSK